MTATSTNFFCHCFFLALVTSRDQVLSLTPSFLEQKYAVLHNRLRQASVSLSHYSGLLSPRVGPVGLWITGPTFLNSLQKYPRHLDTALNLFIKNAKTSFRYIHSKQKVLSLPFFSHEVDFLLLSCCSCSAIHTLHISLGHNEVC